MFQDWAVGVSFQQYTALNVAVREGRVRVAEKLLKEVPELLTAPGMGKGSDIHYAAAGYRCGVCKRPENSAPCCRFTSVLPVEDAPGTTLAMVHILLAHGGGRATRCLLVATSS